MDNQTSLAYLMKIGVLKLQKNVNKGIMVLRE